MYGIITMPCNHYIFDFHVYILDSKNAWVKRKRKESIALSLFPLLIYFFLPRFLSLSILYLKLTTCQSIIRTFDCICLLKSEGE